MQRLLPNLLINLLSATYKSTKTERKHAWNKIKNKTYMHDLTETLMFQ